MLTRTIGTRVQVRTDLAAGLWPALVDPTQIEIAILNLAINSRDAMPLGGALSIETGNLRPATPGSRRDWRPGLHPHFGARHRQRHERRGIALGRRAVLHDERARQGLGPRAQPGLRHGAAVERRACRSKAASAAGTTVHLYLPRAVDAAAAGRDSSGGGLGEPEIGGRILVVDDDAAVREITVQMLRQAGFGVVEAESGQAALDALARGEVYDLLVIDVAMPGLTGVETVRRARERWPALRTLYITGYADIAGAELQTGTDPMLKKPFRLNELTAAVRGALKQAAA